MDGRANSSTAAPKTLIFISFQSITEKGNAKANAIYNPYPEKFPFPSYTGYGALSFSVHLIAASDQEQFIRDKYERKLFTSGAHRSEPPRPASSGGGNHYAQQNQYLCDMGFADPSMNMSVLTAHEGNVQAAVETLLAQKPIVTSTRNLNDDLVDIFGTPTVPAINRERLQEDPVEELPVDDFEAFQSAPTRKTSLPTGPSSEEPRVSSSNGTLGGNPPLPRKVEENPAAALPSIAPMMGNPWASSSNVGNDEAFDDIDPFRGYNPSNRG